MPDQDPWGMMRVTVGQAWAFVLAVLIELVALWFGMHKGK